MRIEKSMIIIPIIILLLLFPIPTIISVIPILVLVLILKNDIIYKMFSIVVILGSIIYIYFNYNQLDFSLMNRIVGLFKTIRDKDFTNHLKFNLSQVLISSLIINGLYLILGTFDVNKVVERTLPTIKRGLKIINDLHCFIVGTTGSGKTTAIMYHIKEAFEKDRFIVTFDGKGDKSDFSMYEMIKDMCEKYNRKLYILDASDPNNSDHYNPFIGATATQIRDMLVNMSEWESPFYASHAHRYWQHMAYFLSIDEGYKGGIGFEQLILLSRPEELLEYAEDLHSRGKIDDYYVELTKSIIEESGKIVQQATARFAMAIEGDGKHIFSKDNSFNIMKAYRENAVVLVMFNKMLYETFTNMVSSLVIDDLKGAVGRWQNDKGFDKNNKALLVFDELSVYVNPRLSEIMNKGRTVCKVVAATQSANDFDTIDNGEAYKKLFIENCNNFVVMQQNEPDSAEYMANVFGTKQIYEFTDKVEMGFDSGVGTKRLVSEYIVHPDIIKNLDSLKGFQLDKKNKEFRYFKLDYIDKSPTKRYLKSHGRESEIKQNNWLFKLLDRGK